jgi:hypothetical protein
MSPGNRQFVFDIDFDRPYPVVAVEIVGAADFNAVDMPLQQNMTALLPVMSVVMFQHVNNVPAIRQSTDIAEHPIRMPVLLDYPAGWMRPDETDCIAEVFKEMNGQGAQTVTRHNLLAVGPVHFQTVPGLASPEDGETFCTKIFLESAETNVVTDDQTITTNPFQTSVQRLDPRCQTFQHITGRLGGVTT